MLRDNLLFREDVLAVDRTLFSKVYGWMCLGLVMSGLMAYFVALNQKLVNLFIVNRLMFWGLIIGELLLVLVLSGMIKRMRPETAGALFAAYSLMNGITLSVVFLVFTMQSVAFAFFITAGTFGLMSVYGYFTKADLSRFGNILLMGLIGLIIASLVNIFLKSATAEWIISIVGVLLFTGLTAYDTQKIKHMLVLSATREDAAKIAILGALTLYLDFINLFLFILRFFGRSRD